jgi:murein DD-endopeptidase MepM/ murein hydrolase activator NlpD
VLDVLARRARPLLAGGALLLGAVPTWLGGGQRVAAATPAPSTPVRFRLPVEDPGAIESAGAGEPWNAMRGPFLVDHDPGTRSGERGLACRDYMGRGGEVGVPWCYGTHTGTDFVLAGGFEQMDLPETNWVVAAADGVVEAVVDTLYDRCHAETATARGGFLDVDCDGRIDGGRSDSNFPANLIVVRHAGNVRTSYLHLKTRSAVVRVGQSVRCGERLARIGSSGVSGFPHLHFEVRGGGMEVVDPFAGPLSQPQSWWVDQGPDHRRIPAARCS